MIEIILYILGGANHYILWILPDREPGTSLSTKQILSLTFWPVMTVITMASIAWLHVSRPKKENDNGFNGTT